MDRATLPAFIGVVVRGVVSGVGVALLNEGVVPVWGAPPLGRDAW